MLSASTSVEACSARPLASVGLNPTLPDYDMQEYVPILHLVWCGHLTILSSAERAESTNLDPRNTPRHARPSSTKSPEDNMVHVSFLRVHPSIFPPMLSGHCSEYWGHSSRSKASLLSPKAKLRSTLSPKCLLSSIRLLLMLSINVKVPVRLYSSLAGLTK